MLGGLCMVRHMCTWTASQPACLPATDPGMERAKEGGREGVWALWRDVILEEPSYVGHLVHIRPLLFIICLWEVRTVYIIVRTCTTVHTLQAARRVWRACYILEGREVELDLRTKTYSHFKDSQLVPCPTSSTIYIPLLYFSIDHKQNIQRSFVWHCIQLTGLLKIHQKHKINKINVFTYSLIFILRLH